MQLRFHWRPPLLGAYLAATALTGSFVHRHDILGWADRLNIVAGRHNIAAVGPQNPQVVYDLLAELVFALGHLRSYIASVHFYQRINMQYLTYLLCRFASEVFPELLVSFRSCPLISGDSFCWLTIEHG